MPLWVTVANPVVAAVAASGIGTSRAELGWIVIDSDSEPDLALGHVDVNQE